ncbi:hypothetical protein ACVWYH_000919 [Bradyrhizobium sp. GM24.11]
MLAADVAGYSRLVGCNEEGTLEQLKFFRTTLIDPKIESSIPTNILCKCT